MQKSIYKPSARFLGDNRVVPTNAYEEVDHVIIDQQSEDKEKLRHKAWSVLHRLQGFETRFALKVVIVTTLLSVPAWLDQSRDWYSKYQSWWAVVFGWLMMHPR